MILPYGRRHVHHSIEGAPAIEAQELEVYHPGLDEPALKDVWLRVPRGRLVALVGPNGAGKSTLLKTLAGLIRPVKGRISLLGQERGNCYHRVSYLPQRGEVDWAFPISLYRLVSMGRYVHLGWFRQPNKEDRELVHHAIEELQLSDLMKRQIGELSGGQQQRALLARCLVQDSTILLLDEPLNAVDSQTVDIVNRVLKNQIKNGKTVIMATHDVERLDNPFDGVLFLHQGREVTPPHAAPYPIEVGRKAF